MGRWVVSGGLGLAGIATGDPSYAYGVLAASLFGQPSLIELYPRGKEIYGKEEKIRSTAVGLLFNTKHKALKKKRGLF